MARTYGVDDDRRPIKRLADPPAPPGARVHLVHVFAGDRRRHYDRRRFARAMVAPLRAVRGSICDPHDLTRGLPGPTGYRCLWLARSAGGLIFSYVEPLHTIALSALLADYGKRPKVTLSRNVAPTGLAGERIDRHASRDANKNAG